MIKIALAGLVNDASIGDRLLVECAQYLFMQKSVRDIEFTYVDFHGRRSRPDNEKILAEASASAEKKQKSTIQNFRSRMVSACLDSQIMPIKNIIYKKQFKRFFSSLGTTYFMKNYFDEYLDEVDLIVIAGGGTIKYDVTVDFSKYYKRLLMAAKERNIPIAIFSVGIESMYNIKDARCRLFSDTLNDPTFKIASTRDNIDEFRKYITNPAIPVSKIADIGVWSSDTYGIVRNQLSETIGIGVIVADRFVQFKSGITPEDYDRILVEIIEKLEARNEIVEIFCNGNPEDEEYAKHICKLTGKDESKIKTARKPRDIVEIISGYKGIISSRLHSCIPAYSLDIPFVAISWNNKLKFFGENIYVSDRIIEKDRLDSDVIIDTFYKAMSYGYDRIFREKYKKTAMDFAEECLKLIK